MNEIIIGYCLMYFIYKHIVSKASASDLIHKFGEYLKKMTLLFIIRKNVIKSCYYNRWIYYVRDIIFINFKLIVFNTYLVKKVIDIILVLVLII